MFSKRALKSYFNPGRDNPLIDDGGGRQMTPNQSFFREPVSIIISKPSKCKSLKVSNIVIWMDDLASSAMPLSRLPCRGAC